MEGVRWDMMGIGAIRGERGDMMKRVRVVGEYRNKQSDGFEDISLRFQCPSKCLT